MFYIIDKRYNEITHFLFTDERDGKSQASSYCSENGYVLVEEKRNSLGNIFWIVQKI